MSQQAQIDADAALARRLQEEEFSQANFPPSPRAAPPRAHPHAYPQPHPQHYPQPPPPPHAHAHPHAYPRPHRHSHDDFPFPFAQGQPHFEAPDMLSEFFRRMSEPGPIDRDGHTAHGLREFGDFPGRGHVLGGASPNPSRSADDMRGGASGYEQMLNNIFNAFGGMEEGTVRGGSFIMTPDGIRFETTQGVGRGSRDDEMRGGFEGGGRGRARNPMMGDPSDMMNIMFSGMFQPLAGGGGMRDNFADWIRNLIPGGMGDGTETYEDWLSIIERMGGNVNRGATDEEVSRLPSHKFHKRPSEREVEREVERGRGRGRSKRKPGAAGPSSATAGGSGSSRQEEGDKCAVCLGEYEDGEDVKALPCTHLFHAECVDRWLKVNRICPVCKQSIRERDGAAE